MTWTTPTLVEICIGQWLSTGRILKHAVVSGETGKAR